MDHTRNVSSSVGSLATSSWYESQFPPTLKSTLIVAAAGTATFAATLSLSTFIQLKLRISTGTTAPIPSLLGMATVGAAAFTSHMASIKSYQVSSYNSSHFSFKDTLLSFSPFRFDIHNKRDIDHLFRVCFMGLIIYKGLGGRFWSISPSSYTTLGSYARVFHSLPATSKYASPAQRIKIERLGKQIGCHTCGSRKIFSRGKNGVKFIADHMPPQAVVKQMNAAWHRRILRLDVKQRFYPQCIDCSGKQGGILSKASQDLLKTKTGGILTKIIPKSNLESAGGGANSYFHGFKGYNLRLEHLTGAVIATLTVRNGSQTDILHKRGGNRRQFQDIEENIKSNIKQVTNYIRDRISWV